MTTEIFRNDFIREWIKDLRGGKYRQGRGCLKDNNGCYCCLGVACETAARLNIICTAFDKVYQREDNFIPQGWMVDILDDNDPDLTVYDEEMGSYIVRRATYINDYLNLSFDDIADALEYTYLKQS